MRSFDYASPTRLEEVSGLLQDHGGVRPLAGGTDLLTLIKADVYLPLRLVNIKELPGMSGIGLDDSGGLRIGALTTLAAIETSELVQQQYPALAEAAAVAATPQLRNMATLGGNLLQRPRCWYYRNARFDCWLKGGETCPMADGENRFAAIFDQSPCWAVHPSDIAPVLVALDAEVRVQGPRGEYGLYVADLLQPPVEARRSESLLGADELITEVRIPPSSGLRMTYLKAMDRKIWAFALVGVAAALRLRERTVTEARLVLSGVANVPLRAVGAEEALIGSEIDPAAIARAADAALEGARPLRDNGYKVWLAKALIRRGLEQLAIT